MKTLRRTLDTVDVPLGENRTLRSCPETLHRLQPAGCISHPLSHAHGP